MGITITEIEIAPPIELTNSSFMDTSAEPTRRLLEHSVVITEVVPNSPAARAGVAQGDLIVSIDFEDVYSAVDFLYRVRKSQPGSIVRLGLVRQNQMLFTEIEVGLRPNVSSDLQLDGFLQRAEMSPTDDQSLYEEFQALKKAMERLEKRLDERK
jgi:C-terminal processing protease CtpA/Prc